MDFVTINPQYISLDQPDLLLVESLKQKERTFLPSPMEVLI